ncbi:N/A [soil metagenome]
MTVALPYHVRQLTIEDGMAIASWRYPGPWAVYDALEPPHVDEGYWAVEDATPALVGFGCFGQAARVPGMDEAIGVLDVALGLRPELAGRGLGRDFAVAVVAHAQEVADGRGLRCVVAEWNAPGQTAAVAAGFRPAGSYRMPGGAAVSSYRIFTQS